MKIERTFPVVPGSAGEARSLVDLIASDLAPETVDNLRLLVSEAVTNAVLHGPDGSGATVYVRVDMDAERVRVDVKDAGPGFVPHARDAPRDDPGGWGLYLVGELADRWGVESEPSTRVWFEIDRPLQIGLPGPLAEAPLVDAIGAAMVATDRRGVITHWNPRAEDLFGFTRAEAVGRPVAEVLLALEDPRAIRAILRRIRDGTPWEGDWHAARKDGEPVDVSVTNSPLFGGPGGSPVGMVGVFADITPRIQAQRRLIAQHAVARILAESMSLEEAATQLLDAIGRNLGWELGAMHLVDPGRARLHCVGTWSAEPGRGTRFLEQTARFAPVIGLGLPGRVWEEARPIRLADVEREANFPRGSIAARDDVHDGIGFPMLISGRVTGVVEFFARSIDQPDEELLRIMTSVGNQIGQFVERHRARDALRMSEARKSAILNAAHDAIVSIDAAGSIIDFNPAAERMFGYRYEDVVGTELAAVLVPPGLRSQHRAALKRYLEVGEPTILGRRVEMPALRAEGTEIPVELTVTKVEAAGTPLFTAYLRDISDRRHAEQLRSELLANERVARAQAESINDRLTFLADASMVFAASLNYRKTLSKLAKLAVPRIADWCSIEMLESDGQVRSLEITHADPEKVALAKRYRERFKPEGTSAILRVIETARSELYPEIDHERVEREVPDAEGRDLMRRLGLRSAMIVPLIARGRANGAITFLSSESGRRFDQSDLEFAEDLARRAALSIDNARLYEERSHVARTLQRSLLPPKLPEIPGVEIAAFYQPAAVERNEVGGDFYDVFELSPGAWGVAIGDVCGKGVEAASLTGFARHTIRAVALHEKSPSAVLATMSEALRKEDGERFCTADFARLDLVDSIPVMTVSCGGHPLPVVVRADGRIEPVGVPGSLLGIFEHVELEDRSVELGPGDAVVFFTDGLIDMRRRPAVDESALEALLTTCAGEDAGRIAETLAEAITDPEGLAPDDVAIVVAQVRS